MSLAKIRKHRKGMVDHSVVSVLTHVSPRTWLSLKGQGEDMSLCGLLTSQACIDEGG